MSLFSLKYWYFSIILAFTVSCVFGLGTGFAVNTVYESFISTDPSKIELNGVTPGEQFGAAVVSGDFNGDGLDDLAVGSPFSSIESRDWNGKISIYFGKKKFKNIKSFNLSSARPDIIFYGAHSGDQLGTTLAAGDYNGDKITDLAIGAYNASSEKGRPGKAYIVYGQSLTWSRQSYDFLSNMPDIELTGNHDGDSFGLALSTIDINNDNVDDILVGAPSASSGSVEESGIVYGFLGSKDGVSTGVHLAKEAKVIFYGQSTGEKFGSAIAGGHIIDKKYSDVVISAYTANVGENNQAGKVYLFKGREKFFSSVKAPTLVIEGKSPNEWLGFALAVGDVNGDDKDDIAISSFSYNGSHKNSKISVFYSKRTFGQNKGIVLSGDDANIVIDKPVDEILIGASVLLDNFNDDKRAEVVVGSPGIGNPISMKPGDVYMVFTDVAAKKMEFSIEDRSVTSTIHGENADDWFGYSLASMDFNGDGKKDLVIGSRYADGVNAKNNGKVFVILGNDQPFGQAKLVPSPEDKYVTRGELIHEVIDKLNLKATKADFLADCLQHKEFCLFNFTAMSLYNGITLDPNLILYPDVSPDTKYYDDINIGTMLGLVTGMVDTKDSPFMPESPITRIQSLKIILGAIDAVKPLYKFELIKQLGGYDKLVSQASRFKDVDPRVSYMWWYPRYTNFAVANGIIKANKIFRPDDNISVGELDSMLKNTLEFLNK